MNGVFELKITLSFRDFDFIELGEAHAHKPHNSQASVSLSAEKCRVATRYEELDA